MTFNSKFYQHKAERSIVWYPSHISNNEVKCTLLHFHKNLKPFSGSLCYFNISDHNFKYFVLFWIKYDAKYSISMRKYTPKLFLQLANYTGQSSPSLFLDSNMYTPKTCGLPLGDAVCVAAWAPKEQLYFTFCVKHILYADSYMIPSALSVKGNG
jgi:hypothetical protein